MRCAVMIVIAAASSVASEFVSFTGKKEVERTFESSKVNNAYCQASTESKIHNSEVFESYSLNQVYHSTEELNSNANKASILAIISGTVFALLAVIAVLSTFDDCRSDISGKKKKSKFASLSLRRNIKSLLNLDQTKSPDEVSCLHGMRAICTLSIIFLHSYFYRVLTPVGEKNKFVEWSRSGTALSVSSLNITVDTFFVISALLLTKTFLKDLDQNRFSISRTIFQRYMRLTPSLIVVILANQTLAYHLSHKEPQGFLSYSVVPCEKFWWSALLHLQVQTNPSEMCMHTTWFLSVDWIMTIFAAPALVYLLWRFGKKTCVVIAGVVSISALHTFNISYDNQFYVQEVDLTTDIRGEFYDKVYYPVAIRGSPFLIGILLGYFLYHRKRSQSVENKLLRYGAWFWAFMAISTPFSASGFFAIVGKNLLLNSLFFALIRNIWGFGIAWIIFVCHFGGGGSLNKFLSSKYWMPIMRLGFSLYLVHPVIQYNLNSSRTQFPNLEFSHMLWNYTKDLGFSIPASIFLHLLVELPFSAIGKIISSHWTAERNVAEKSPSEEKSSKISFFASSVEREKLKDIQTLQ